jgi:urea transport system ATP-binding protein
MLIVDNLKVSYGETQVLFDVNLQVNDGEIVCLMGRNGVGKTTLLNTIMGLLPVGGGRLELNGRNMIRIPPHSRAWLGIGYVPQGRGIIPGLTVEENLLIGLEAFGKTDPAVVRQRRGANEAIAEVLEVFPALKPIYKRRGGNLSGGQQQQLAIARALIAKPLVLLLDEPTEGIQPSIIDQIEDLLLALKAKRQVSILLIEQYVDFAVKVADRYYFMETGSIVADGQVAQLTDEIIHEYMDI